MWGLLKRLKIGLPYYSAILLLGIYPMNIKVLIQNEICNPVVIVTPFTITKIQKQPKLPVHMNGEKI